MPLSLFWPSLENKVRQDTGALFFIHALPLNVYHQLTHAHLKCKHLFPKRLKEAIYMYCKLLVIFKAPSLFSGKKV